MDTHEVVGPKLESYALVVQENVVVLLRVGREPEGPSWALLGRAKVLAGTAHGLYELVVHQNVVAMERQVAEMLESGPWELVALVLNRLMRKDVRLTLPAHTVHPLPQ